LVQIFSRKWFCLQKIFFDKKIFMNFFGANLFSRKWFCTQNIFGPKNFDENDWCKSVFEEFIMHTKIFSTKKFSWKFLVQICFRGNDFSQKIFLDLKILLKIFGAHLFSRKWFFTKNNFGPKNFVEKFWCKSVFEEIILHTKNFFD
jgi:hypothetical protein